MSKRLWGLWNQNPARGRDEPCGRASTGSVAWRTSASDHGRGLRPDISAEPVPALGPVRPSEGVRSELERFLRADASRLGEASRGVSRGQTADEIAEELGVATSGFVWNTPP